MNTMSHERKTPHAGQYLTFQLRSELFGIPIQDIREINQHGEITPVPFSSSAVKGVMNLRGKIIPVLSLRLKFGMQETPLTRESCIIVIDTNLGQMGMIVDSVKEVQNFEASQLEHSPTMQNKASKEIITGIGKIETKVVILLDVKSILSLDEIESIQGNELAA